MRHKTLLCNCNRTMKMDGKTITAALGESGEPRIHVIEVVEGEVEAELCGLDPAACLGALAGTDDATDN
jgi:hypothetical protein